MAKQQVVKFLIVVAFAGAALGSIGAWRYFRIPVELRFSAHEAWWQAAPYVLILIISAALLLRKDANG